MYLCVISCDNSKDKPNKAMIPYWKYDKNSFNMKKWSYIDFDSNRTFDFINPKLGYCKLAKVMKDISLIEQFDNILIDRVWYTKKDNGLYEPEDYYLSDKYGCRDLYTILQKFNQQSYVVRVISYIE